MIQAPSEHRKTTYGSIEIGRFVAALVVVFDHSLLNVRSQSLHPQAPLLAGLVIPAALAVQYFFVISGFVMFTAHRADFGRWTAPPAFWWRRACRIYPMYWLAMAIMLIYLWRLMTPTYTWQLLSLYPGPSPEMIPSAWTLRYEVGFYVMFGLMLLPWIGRPLLLAWVAGTIWEATPAARWADPFVGHYLAYFVTPYGFYFFAGLLGGWVHAQCSGRTWGKIWRNWALLGFGGLLLLSQMPAIGWGGTYGVLLTRIIVGVAIAALIAGFAGLERDGALTLGTWARRLGAISYPLYILHRSLAQLVGMNRASLHLADFGLYVLLILLVAGQLAASFAITFSIDRPVQRLLRRIGAGKRPDLVRAEAAG